jgi:hypothetical protein
MGRVARLLVGLALALPLLAVLPGAVAASSSVSAHIPTEAVAAAAAPCECLIYVQNYIGYTGAADAMSAGPALERMGHARYYPSYAGVQPRTGDIVILQPGFAGADAVHGHIGFISDWQINSSGDMTLQLKSANWDVGSQFTDGGCTNVTYAQIPSSGSFNTTSAGIAFYSRQVTQTTAGADLVFAIDTTGSMVPYIAAVQTASAKLVDQVMASGNARIAVVEYRDLYSGCPDDGFASRVDLGFSTDKAAILAAINGLVASGGCDTPESVYSGLMSAIGLPWRNGVTKSIVLAGDAPPHDPEPVTGYTLASVVAAAKAVDPANVYAIDINGGGGTAFADLATGSGGADYPASSPDEAVTAIGSALTTIFGTTYHPVTPTRVLDTRNGTGGLSGPFTNHVARTFGVAGGSSGVPANATAVTGNLTVTGQTSNGYLFIGPVATNNPTSSTLNFPVGDDRANAVTVALGAGGTLSITFVAPSNGPTAQAIFDVTGYFTLDMTGATYHALSPARVLDTRNGAGGLSGPFGNHAARTFGVTGGSNGVPSNAIAVTGNLTVTGQTSSGYLFIGPVATNNPTSSTLNFPVGDDRANAVTVALGAGGTLSITFVAPSNGPTAQAIFDVTGYFTADMTGAVYVPLTPTRILDTRNGTGGLSGPFTNHAARTFGGSSGVPANAIAVTGNLTVTGQTSNGYLYIGPVATNNPTSSTLNFPVGDDRANAVTVALSGGSLSITFVAPSNGPTAQSVFDVTGYFVQSVG